MVFTSAARVRQAMSFHMAYAKTTAHQDWNANPSDAFASNYSFNSDEFAIDSSKFPLEHWQISSHEKRVSNFSLFQLQLN
jgi:hypothetical protein